MTLQSQPRGFYFELSDLTVLRAWSEFHDLRMVAEWDHCIGDEQYEQVLAFYPFGLKFRRWSMWRTSAMHFTSVAGAVDWLIPVADEAANRERRSDGHRWVNPPHLLHSN